MRQTILTLFLVAAACLAAAPTRAQFSAKPDVPELPVRAAALAENEAALHYTVQRDVTLFSSPDRERPYLELDLRTPLYLLRAGRGWAHVRTEDGAEGYLPRTQISNVWVRVSKKQRAVYLYRGTELVKKVPADFGYNAFSDKEKRGSNLERDHWRTPEGTFYVVSKNPHSRFYKALVLNYPTAEDAIRGYDGGLISRQERDAIVRAQREHQVPPMNTPLGGWIEIHGDGTGAGADWTQGCVAVENADIDELWQFVKVGTPVLIE